MPKQTPSIPNDVLWARLGDRSVLSDELWLIAAQVGMLLGRSIDQLAEDRKVGNPPAFKKHGGSIRYRLGSVRDHMLNSPEFNNTTQARLAGDRNYSGLFANVDAWKNRARGDVHWPFLIRTDGQMIDFWESLSLGDQLRDTDRCEWLCLDDYLIETSRPVVMRREFLSFLAELRRQSPDDLAPSTISRLSHEKIYDSLHLVWIREILNGTFEEKQSLGGRMAIATATEILQCRGSYWTIREGVYRLLDESPVILTRTAQLRQSEIQGYITAAEDAANYGTLPCKIGHNNAKAVKAIDLLKWALDNHVPVPTQIVSLFRSKRIGAISPSPRPGRPLDPAANLRGTLWRKFAYQYLKSHPRLSISDAAKTIANDPSLNPKNDKRTEATIRKQLSRPRMIADGY